MFISSTIRNGLLVGLLLCCCALCRAEALPGYTALAALNQAESWQAADGVRVASSPAQMLTFTVGDLPENAERRVMLRQPAPLDAGVAAVDYWCCFPPAPEEFGLSLTPLFADRDGKEIDGSKELFLCSHIGAPNSRKAGLWFFESEERNAKAVALLGFTVQVIDRGAGARPEHTIYLKDFGLSAPTMRRCRCTMWSATTVRISATPHSIMSTRGR